MTTRDPVCHSSNPFVPWGETNECGTVLTLSGRVPFLARIARPRLGCAGPVVPAGLGVLVVCCPAWRVRDYPGGSGPRGGSGTPWGPRSTRQAISTRLSAGPGAGGAPGPQGRAGAGRTGVPGPSWHLVRSHRARYGHRKLDRMGGPGPDPARRPGRVLRDRAGLSELLIGIGAGLRVRLKWMRTWPGRPN